MPEQAGDGGEDVGKGGGEGRPDRKDARLRSGRIRKVRQDGTGERGRDYSAEEYPRVWAAER